VWLGLWAVLVVPSPKSQAHVVTVPVVVLVKLTLSGASPLVELILKFGTGGAAETLIGFDVI
jgi:hypothetical protein